MNHVNSFKKAVKRSFVMAILSVTAMLMLGGCGNKTPEGYYILDSVTQVSGGTEADSLTAHGLDKSYIVINGSKGYLVLMGTPEDITYDADKGVVTTSFGDIPAAVNGNVLTLADRNVTMDFRLSDKAAPSKPDYPMPPEPEETVEDTEVNEEAEAEAADTEEDQSAQNVEEVTEGMSPEQSEAMNTLWNGYWFGYWTVDPVEPVWKDHAGNQFFVLARTGIDDEGNTEIHIWDNDYAVADVFGTNDGSGSSECGTFVSTDGVFWDGDDLTPGEWTIDPAESGHKDTICIKAVCNYDSVPQFNYTINLVKWGSDWSDYEEDDLPDIMEWYKQQLADGITDPLTLKLPEQY